MRYAAERTGSGRRIAGRLGLGHLLADMADAVDSARAVHLDAHAAAFAGPAYARHASAVVGTTTDTAMAVTQDAVQLFGDAAGHAIPPVERSMREAKASQAIAGNTRMQRRAIGRAFAAQ